MASEEFIFAAEAAPPAWAILMRDARSGRVDLILWPADKFIGDPAAQEAAMLHHPDIFKVWRLEEVK